METCPLWYLTMLAGPCAQDLDVRKFGWSLSGIKVIDSHEPGNLRHHVCESQPLVFQDVSKFRLKRQKHWSRGGFLRLVFCQFSWEDCCRLPQVAQAGGLVGEQGEVERRGRSEMRLSENHWLLYLQIEIWVCKRYLYHIALFDMIERAKIVIFQVHHLAPAAHLGRSSLDRQQRHQGGAIHIFFFFIRIEPNVNPVTFFSIPNVRLAWSQILALMKNLTQLLGCRSG